MCRVVYAKFSGCGRVGCFPRWRRCTGSEAYRCCHVMGDVYMASSEEEWLALQHRARRQKKQGSKGTKTRRIARIDTIAYAACTAHRIPAFEACEMTATS